MRPQREFRRTLQKGFRKTGNPDLVSDIAYFSNSYFRVKCYLLGLESNPIFDNIPYLPHYQYHVSELFIRKFQDMFNWYAISSDSQTLSQPFIRKFQDKVCWYHISFCQTISEDLIRDFQDKVNWEKISEYQQLGISFIREFRDKLDWSAIIRNQKIRQETKSKTLNDFSMDKRKHYGND